MTGLLRIGIDVGGTNTDAALLRGSVAVSYTHLTLPTSDLV